MVDLQDEHSLFRQLWSKLKGRTFRQLVWGVLFFLAAALVVGSNFLSGGYSFKEGQVSPTNIYARGPLFMWMRRNRTAAQ